MAERFHTSKRATLVRYCTRCRNDHTLREPCKTETRDEQLARRMRLVASLAATGRRTR